MTAQKVTGFLGLLPRTAERLLPDLAAQKAENVILTSGEIRPIRPPYPVYYPLVDGQYQTAYRAFDGTTEKWRAWLVDVDVARGPLPPDVEQRYYWTGDGCPKCATFTQFGTTEYALGVPNPIATPTATPSGGVGSTVSRVYCLTFYQPATGEESGSSPVSNLATGKVDATWAIANLEAAPANSGGITSLTYSGKSVTATSAVNHYNRVGDQITIAGVQTVTNVNGTWALTAINTAAKTMTFTVTGTPTGTYNNTTDAADTWTRAVSWNVAGLYHRLYRSAGANATFQLVAERAVSTGTWNDTLTDSLILGDELISASWEPPPANMLGIIVLPNGATVGFVGNELCFSEPYQPHAYPPEYRYQAESKIIGIASFGTAVVAATETRPYVADGVEPDSVTLTGVANIWPCKSKRSVCSAGDGVVYAAETGLAFIGASGSYIFTKNLFTAEEWRPLKPETMTVKVLDNRIYIHFLEDGASTRRMLRVDMGEQAALVEFSANANALYADTLNGLLYFVGEQVGQFDALVGAREDWIWKGKEIELPGPINLGCALIEWASVMSVADVQAAYSMYEAELAANQVIIDAGLEVGAFGMVAFNEVQINGATGIKEPGALSEYLYYTLMIDDQAIFTRLVEPGVMFRLPAGYKSDVVTHQLSGNVRVKYLKAATTPGELRAA